MTEQQTENHKYIIGDTVTIYQKPITQEEFEGLATIINLTNTKYYYEIQFDDEPEQTYFRFIY